MQLVTHDLTVQPFDFNGQAVRVVVRDDNEPCFILNDVCEVLNISNPRNVAARIDEDSKGVCLVDTPGGSQKLTTVDEAGMYEVILRSEKPEAKSFRRWVTREVLPSIRKHGAYLSERKIEQVLDDPDTIIQLATKLKEERAAKAELERKQAEDAPKVLFADSVATSHTVISIGDMAKILCQNGINTGQRRFFEWLRQHGFLMRREGTDYNMPTQKSMELGLFQVTERAISKPSGDVFLSKTVKVTGKGQQYFVDRFLSGQLVA